MPRSHRSPAPLIEPLEDRIAPALLINGANLLGGAGNPNSGETSVGENSASIVKVLSGQALVWFDSGSIVGISVGPNTSLEINGNVFGDIVANLTAGGRLSDSDNDPVNGEDGRVLLPNNILGIVTKPLAGMQKGDVQSIITGGSVSNVVIGGEIGGIYAGDGVFRSESLERGSGGAVTSSLRGIDFNPLELGAQTSFVFTQAEGSMAPGASITKVKISEGRQLQVFAGSGNPNGTAPGKIGLAGGSIRDITIDSAYLPAEAPESRPSYHLLAGDGAGGGTGGVGGSIDKVVEKASYGPVVLHGGTGGEGTAGRGGSGGAVMNIDLQSDASRYFVTGGDGGRGVPGGDGGKVINSNFANRTPLGGVIATGDFDNDGAQDVIVADPGTGHLVLHRNLGDGSHFTPVAQYSDTFETSVVLIDGGGVTPSAADTLDFNGDGKLDLVVAYKNSNSIVVHLNQGGGVFYDPTLGDTGGFVTVTGILGHSPVKLEVLNGTADFATVENRDGKGYIHILTINDRSESGMNFISHTSKPFSQPVVDIVAAPSGNKVFAALSNGALFTETMLGTINTQLTVTNGLNDLAIDSTGGRLLAVSSIGRTVSVFGILENAPEGTPQIQLLETLQPATGAEKPLSAQFVPSGAAGMEDRIAVLTSQLDGARVDVFAPVAPDADVTTVDPFYQLQTSLETTATLKQFVIVDSKGDKGFAALAGSLSQFTFGDSFLDSEAFPLPFASKKVSVTGGNGGDGIDLPKKAGKGGAGGNITAINADAHDISLTAGLGGNSQTGPGGAGGSIGNPDTFLTASGIPVAPALRADERLDIKTGDGGVPQASGKLAAGGAGGSINKLTLSLLSGDIVLGAGNGGDARGGAAGAGGNVNGLQSISHDGSLFVTAGMGGTAKSGLGNGGAGGSITGVNFELTLDTDTEDLEQPYTVALTAGVAGKSEGGTGGAGGHLSDVRLKLDGSDRTYFSASNPPLIDAKRDNTVRVLLSAGDGADGAKGGLGGSIKGLKYESVYDQVKRAGSLEINYVVMSLVAGNGGNGAAGDGGGGGGVAPGAPISGITYFDPQAPTPAENPTRAPLFVLAGSGGDGSLKGGAGGSITGVVAQNAMFTSGGESNSVITQTHLAGAHLAAGDGGKGGTHDGGKGGSILNSLIGVQAAVHENPDSANGASFLEGGFLNILAGRGGSGGTAQNSLTGKGGGGGTVTNNEFGLVTSAVNVGMVIAGGAGGDGVTAGGLGGAVATLRVNVSQSTEVPAALVLGGDGGGAKSLKGVGGKGGDITGIAQLKDVNSSINLIQAGNGGGNTLGKGGAGGNVSQVKTVGFIGRPTDVDYVFNPVTMQFDEINTPLGAFDTIETSEGPKTIAQGVFSGRGGNGVTDGLSGTIMNIAARQIAAMAGAMDPQTLLFAAALKIAQVKADVIGFDANRDGNYDDTDGGGVSPSQAVAADGFLLSAAPLVGVTGQRLGFVFTA